MKKLPFILLLLTLSCTVAKREERSLLQVGASAAHVNPSVGAFIAGDKQNRRFAGVHDSLYAKAVVVDDGTTTLAIVTIDCIGLLNPEVQRIQQAASLLTGIPAERIIVSSTHTHSGPDVVGLWGEDYLHSGVDTAYTNFLVNTAAQQVENAFKRKQAASVITTETTFGEPWVQNICGEEIDRAVTVMQFTTEGNKSIATLTNFACHPTFMDAKFDQVSADYVSGFYKSMNRVHGGENLFLQGAIGGWVQPEDGESSFEKAEQRGMELATAVIEALKKGSPMNESSIRFNSKIITLPVENEDWKQLAAIGTVKRTITDSLETEIAWFSIGSAQFATHPGETTPYLGLETKKMMKSGPRFVLGLTQDALGYILKPEYFSDTTKPHAAYLTRMSLGRETSPLLHTSLQQLIP